MDELDALYKFNVATEEEAKRNLAAEPASGEDTHGSPELDADAAKLVAMGADPGPTFAELFAPPPPPPQGEEEIAQALAKELFGLHYAARWPIIAAALRQRAAEATRAENEACAKEAEQQAHEFLSPEYAVGQPLSSFAERFACSKIAAAIRGRIKP